MIYPKAAVAAFLRGTARRILDPDTIPLGEQDARALLTFASGIEAKRDPDAPDTRGTARRVRVRLFPLGGPDTDPAADTAPDLPADQPGSMLVASLPAMAAAVAALCFHFHGVEGVTGLDKADLDRGIRGLRVTLSRRGGEATWRLPYQVHGSKWMARVDVVTE